MISSSLSPYGFDALTPGSAESSGTLPWSQEFVPLGAVALFSTCSPEYQDNINTVVAKANLVYMDFLKSDEGKGFNGQVRPYQIFFRSSSPPATMKYKQIKKNWVGRFHKPSTPICFICL